MFSYVGLKSFVHPYGNPKVGVFAMLIFVARGGSEWRLPQQYLFIYLSLIFAKFCRLDHPCELRHRLRPHQSTAERLPEPGDQDLP